MTMPLSFRFRPARAVALALVLAALLSAFLWADSVPAQGSGGVDLDAVDLPPLRYPNLGSRLSWMAQDVEDGTATEADAAARAVESDGTSVGVRIVFSSGQEALGNFLSEVGGSVDYVSGDSMKAWVPVAELGRLSRLPITVEARESVPPQPAGPPAMGSVRSQGVRLHGADVWYQAGHTGSGVKVGILDVGFTGFAELVRNRELPMPYGIHCGGTVRVSLTVAPAVSSLSPDDLSACALDRSGNPQSHGTATAETIMDIAPDAAIYIGMGNPSQVVSWFRTQGVVVVNASMGWGFDSAPANKGTKGVKKAVADFLAGGNRVWVNAAGNGADGENWFSEGPFTDSDGDGYIDFPGSGESVVVDIPAGPPRLVQLRWDGSWPGNSRDIDLVVHDFNGRAVRVRDSSYGATSNPYEFVSLYPGSYYLAVRFRNVPLDPGWIQLQVWKSELSLSTARGSMGNPAEMELDGFLAVGASDYSRDPGGSIASYSSRGPVPGETYKKPDLVGVSCTDSLSIRQPYASGPTPYCGTSNASPHVAGLAALVVDRYGSSVPGSGGVAGYLKRHSVHPRGLDADDVWGHGFFKLPGDFAVAGRYSLHPSSGQRSRDVAALPPVGSGKSFKVCYDLAGADCVKDPSSTESPKDDLVGEAAGITLQPGGTRGSGDVTLYVYEEVSVPGPPGVVSAVLSGDGDVNLSWTAPDDDGGSPITHYEYLVSCPTPVPSAGWVPVPDGTSVTIAGLSRDVPHLFFVRAVNVAGGGNPTCSTSAVTVPPAPTPAPTPTPVVPVKPSVPSGLIAVAGDGSVTLKWSYPGNAAAEVWYYEFQVNHNDTSNGNFSGWGPWVTASGTGPSSTSFSPATVLGADSHASNVVNGREYRFKLRAVGSGGTGGAAPGGSPWYVSATPSASSGNSVVTSESAVSTMGHRSVPLSGPLSQPSTPPRYFAPPDPDDDTRVLTYEVVPSCTLTPSSGDIGDSFSVSCIDVDDAHDYFVMDGTTELRRGRSSRGNARFDLTAGSPNSGNSYSFTLEYGANRARRLELSFAFSMGCTVSRTDGALDGHGPGVLYREDSFDLVCTGLPDGAEYEVHGGTGRSVYRGISHLATSGSAEDGVIRHTLTPEPPFTERLRGGPLYYELEVRPKRGVGGFSTLRTGVMVLPTGKVAPSSAAPGESFRFDVMDMLAVGAVHVRNEVSGERSNVACYGTSGVRGRAGRDGVASLELLLPQGLEPEGYELEAYSLNFVSGSGENCVDFDALPGAPYNLVVARVDFFVDWLEMQISPGALVRGQRATASGYGFSQLASGQEVTGFYFFGEGGLPCPPPAAPPWDPDYYKGLLCWASGVALDLASVDVDYSGFYSVEFVVPLDVPVPVVVPELGGDVYALNAVSHDGAESLGGFVLLEPELSLSESSSRRGLKITVDGTGFPARRPVTLHHGEGGCPEGGGAPVSAIAGHVLSGDDGSFSVEIEVPREPAADEYRYGDFLVTAVSGPYDGPQFKGVVACTSVEHSVPFPQVTLRPHPVSPGIPLRIEGEFFQPYTAVDSVEVLSYTLSGSNARVDGEGRFVVDTTLPDILAVGVYPLRVRLSDGTFIGFRIRVAKPGEIGFDVDLVFRDFGDVLEDVWVYDFDAGVWVDLVFGQEGSSSSLLPGDLVALSLSGAATYRGESYGPGLHFLFVELY